MAEFARKISTVSRDSLPPSYSRCDLRHIGLTINDHFNPPPSYDRAVESAANANNGEYIANAYNNPSDLTRNCSRCVCLRAILSIVAQGCVNVPSCLAQSTQPNGPLNRQPGL